jgi:eukaryotic-like serine/threonine-protein kinase
MVAKQLNHYTILEPLGQGGMGEVFIAEDTRLHRRIALKVLSGLTAGDPEQRARFEREARAVAALNHPNIVTIHSVEDAEGVPFLTMELVEGKSLSSLITPNGMPLDALLRIGIEISDAIAAAHQKGITHRDLKPANVMITHEGRVKVLDFGLAKLREAELDANGVTRMPSNDLTGEGRIIGTIAYMSPEQAEGKVVDQRSDIFSLGVMLHEMATGERPFKGDTNVSVMSAILKDTPSAITDIKPNLPTGLARVIRKALAKDPSRRYQTATDLRNDLEELKQESGSAPTVSINAMRHDVAVKDRSRATKLAAAALVILGIVAITYYSGRPASRGPQRFELEKFTRLTSSGSAQIAAISPDGRYVVHIKAEGPPSLWIRQTATMSDVQIVPASDARYDGLTFSPDGNFVYYVTYAGTGGVASLYRIPVLGGSPQKLLEDIDSRVSFSPDGQQFTFVRGAPAKGRNYLIVSDLTGTGVKTLASLEPPDQMQLTAPSWSPDGKTIIIGVQSLRDGPHNAAFAVDVASGAAHNIGGRWAFVHDMEWMGDGDSFIVSATEFGGQVPQLWQVTYPGGERQRVTNDLNNYIGVSIAKDGRSIATVQIENSSNLWVSPAADPASAKQITTGQGRGDGLTGLSWTPDGKIVFTSSASGHPEVWIIDSDGANLRQVTNTPVPSVSPAATPDGKYIVYQHLLKNGVFIYRSGVDGSNATALTTGGADTFPVVSRDSKWVYYTSVTSGQPRPFKVSIDGGNAVSLGDFYFRASDASPDDSTLVGMSWDEEGRRSRLATMPASGGTRTLLPYDWNSGALWSPDGKSLTYLDVAQRPLNLWSRDLQAGTSRQLTKLPPGNLFSAAWSRDWKTIAVARGTSSSDVVIVTAKQPDSK